MAIDQEEKRSNELAEKINEAMIGHSVAECLWATATLFGYAAAQTNKDLDSILERLRPVMDMAMQRKLKQHRPN